MDFDEELKKFQPSLEVEDLENAVNKQNNTDVMDVFSVLLGETANDSKSDGIHWVEAKE